MEEEVRSSDGSDTEGSLKDFIVEDVAENELVVLPQAEISEENIIVPDEHANVRRSTRLRRTVNRYQDADFRHLIMTKGGEITEQDLNLIYTNSASDDDNDDDYSCSDVE